MPIQLLVRLMTEQISQPWFQVTRALAFDSSYRVFMRLSGGLPCLVNHDRSRTTILCGVSEHDSSRSLFPTGAALLDLVVFHERAMNVSTNQVEKKQLALDLSVVHRNTQTLQVCDQAYDSCPPSFLDTSELFYESRAMYVFYFSTRTPA